MFHRILGKTVYQIKTSFLLRIIIRSIPKSSSCRASIIKFPKDFIYQKTCQHLLKLATAAWASEAANRPILGDDCTEASLEKEADWVQSTLISVLNRHAKAVRLCAHSKRWWRPELQWARSWWALICKQGQARVCFRAMVRTARANYYWWIRNAKRTC